MKILYGYKDTRSNNEDIALTPYLFGVYNNEDKLIIGFGICWIYSSIFVAIHFIRNDKTPFLINLTQTIKKK